MFSHMYLAAKDLLCFVAGAETRRGEAGDRQDVGNMGNSPWQWPEALLTLPHNGGKERVWGDGSLH
jgi:hypothetical protein